MSKINTNMASVTTLYHLNNKEGSMNQALERISSGLRLNHAVDDAAGASIVNRMTSQIKGIEAAIRNAADAISLTQTAEGSLEEVSQILHRMRELSVQAANGVYTGQDRQALNNEIVAMQNELGRIAESSRFNGVKMLNGDFQDTTFQIGFTANDTATLSIEDVRPQGLGEYILSSSNSNVADVVIGLAPATRTVSTAGSSGASPAVTLGLASGIYSGDTARTVTLAEASGGDYAAAFDGSNTDGDIFKISVNGSEVSYTLGAGEGSTLNGVSGTAGKLAWLAAKFTTVADTAGLNSSDLGVSFSEASGDLVVTYDDVGIAGNSQVIGTLQFEDYSTGTARVMSLPDHGTPAYDLALKQSSNGGGSLNISGGQAFSIAISGQTPLSVTLTGGQATALDGAANLADRLTLLAGYLDAAVTDQGVSVTAGSTNLIVTFDATDASNNSVTVGPLQVDGADLGADATETTPGANAGFNAISGSGTDVAGVAKQVKSGDTITLTDGSKTLTYVVQGSDIATDDTTTVANIVTGLKTDTDYASASFTIAASSGNIAFTMKSPGSGFTGSSVSLTTDGASGSLPTVTKTVADGTKEQSSSTISAPEGDMSIALSKLSGDADTANTINKIVADYPGGTFTLSGTDASKFTIDANGTITGRLDYETAADQSNSFEVNYKIDGTTLVTETVTLNITDRISDNNNTQVSAFAQPRLGKSLDLIPQGIVEAEDFTIYGNVGTRTIDVNGGSSARDVVAAVNSVQGETGVYAEAQTRVNIAFPDQSEAISDTVTFTLYGKNTLPQVVSGTVDFGIVNGRDANLRALADAVNNASGATGISAKVSSNGATLSLISNEGYDIVLKGYELTASNIDASVYPADEALQSIGNAQLLAEGSDENNSMRVGGVLTFHSPYVFSISTAADGSKGGGLFQQTPGAAQLSAVSDLNVLSVENAKKMLTSVDGALVRVDLERSDIGATMSRMEHTISNLSNIALNTKGARSRIQDADIAAETVELNRAQVLSQAAQAMLAQANRTSQSILSLLQG